IKVGAIPFCHGSSKKVDLAGMGHDRVEAEGDSIADQGVSQEVRDRGSHIGIERSRSTIDPDRSKAEFVYQCDQAHLTHQGRAQQVFTQLIATRPYSIYPEVDTSRDAGEPFDLIGVDVDADQAGVDFRLDDALAGSIGPGKHAHAGNIHQSGMTMTLFLIM